MKKLIVITLILACIFSLTGCGFFRNCDHAYYRSDYQAPGAGTNGYSVYTCRKCGENYRETEPALNGNTSSQMPTFQNKEEDVSNGYGKTSRTIRLFDLPVYSKSNGLNPLDYVSDCLDTNGYRHKDCYMIAGSTDGYKYLRYELDGKYTTLSGSIYQLEKNTGTMWLEFYDGDEFLFSTARLGENNKNVEFEIDITGVNHLTVYPMAENLYYGCWIIADQITISK